MNIIDDIHPAQQMGALNKALELIRRLADNEYVDARNRKAKDKAQSILSAIDAAPELLQALKNIEKCAGGGIVYDDAPSQRMDMAMCRDAASFAIVKYEGLLLSLPREN